mmetsp:Transcript_10324/g.21714  ORF Transcript_10324/g.21714 Transcript_10324/m.21714 type:complete len:218 (+) Transcript_10324:283-936(+)
MMGISLVSASRRWVSAWRRSPWWRSARLCGSTIGPISCGRRMSWGCARWRRLTVLRWRCSIRWCSVALRRWLPVLRWRSSIGWGSPVTLRRGLTVLRRRGTVRWGSIALRRWMPIRRWWSTISCRGSAIARCRRLPVWCWWSAIRLGSSVSRRRWSRTVRACRSPISRLTVSVCFGRPPCCCIWIKGNSNNNIAGIFSTLGCERVRSLLCARRGVDQ